MLLRPLTLSLMFLASCSTSDGDAPTPSASAEGGTTVTCESEPRDVYVADLEKPGKQGFFKFVLVQSDPAPPARGRNSWVLKILDAGGKPVSGARIGVDAFMPSHGHGSPTVPAITPAGDGYAIGPISLFMPGLWEVTLDAAVGGISDSVVFRFCIAG